MSPEIHGHAVIDLLLASGRTFSRDTLVDYITRHFGAETRFHTCSAYGLSAEQLVDLFAAKGKLTGPSDALRFDARRVCAH